MAPKSVVVVPKYFAPKHAKINIFAYIVKRVTRARRAVCNKCCGYERKRRYLWI